MKELGGASERQIKKYLPAMTDDLSDVMDKKKFERCLYSAVYSGYLITDGTKYRVAPYDYYLARQEVVVKNKERFAEGKTKKRRKHADLMGSVEYVRPLWHWWVIASVGVIFTCVGFLGGLLLGLLLHSV